MKELVNNPDPRFFVNDLKPYFKGTEKIIRNLERRNLDKTYVDERNTKFEDYVFK